MLVAGLTLTGQWTILWAHMAYARHVLLDAHGLLAPRSHRDARVWPGARAKSPRAEAVASAGSRESQPRGNAAACADQPAKLHRPSVRDKQLRPARRPKSRRRPNRPFRQPPATPRQNRRSGKSSRPSRRAARRAKPTTRSPTTIRPIEASRGPNGNGSSASSVARSATPPDRAGRARRGCPAPQASTMMPLGRAVRQARERPTVEARRAAGTPQLRGAREAKR